MNDPENYIWNHFSEMKNKVDLIFDQRLAMDNISEDETKSVSNDRLEIIEKIKAYESECLFAIR